MKQKQETYYSARLKGIVPFRNDIERVLTILNDSGLDISIEDDNNVYDSINEVIHNVGTNPRKIEIRGKNKNTYESVGLIFEKTKLLINCHGSEQMYSLGFRIKEYFSKTIPWHYRIFNPWIYYFTTITPLLALTFAFDKTTGELKRPWILVFFSLSLLLWFFSYILRNNAYGIKLIKNHEYGFWKRNKDGLKVSIISTIIGAILGVICTLLVQYIST